MIEIIKQWRRDLLFKLRLRPIDFVFKTLKNKGLSSFDHGLEVFGYTGEYHTQNYQHLVKELHVWEINGNYESALKKNLPNAIIKITDSFAEIQKTDLKFDLVVIDNPLSFYGNYCEHYQILPLSFRVLKNRSTVIINVITNVNYIYEKYRAYDPVRQNKMRSSWYLLEDATVLKDDFILNFYRTLCRENGFETEFSFLKKRNKMVSYLVMHLKSTL